MQERCETRFLLDVPADTDAFGSKKWVARPISEVIGVPFAYRV